MAKSTKSKEIRCSFCGKSQNSVERIIAGPGVYICNECIKVCSNIVEDELYENNGDGKAQCFVFEENDEIALYPFLINSVNELGYDLDNEYFDIQGAYGYNGAVSSSYDEDIIKKFLFCFEVIYHNKQALDPELYQYVFFRCNIFISPSNSAK